MKGLRVFFKSERLATRVVLGTGFVLLVTATGIGMMHIRTSTNTSFLQTKDTLTILTTPLAVLPPHAHKESATGIDSVLAPGHGVLVESERYEIPFDMWVVGIEKKSDRAPLSILHHLILYKAGYPNAQCSNRDAEIYNSGADTHPTVSFLSPYGVFLKKGTVIYLRGMVHNPEPPRGPGGTYTGSSVGYTLTYERPSPKRSKPVLFYRLFLYDGLHCLVPEETVTSNADVFTVPNGAKHFEKIPDAETKNNQARMTFTTSGTIIGLGGHLHPEDGGEKLEFLKGDEVIATIVPKQISAYVWESLRIGNPDSIRVTSGDTFSIRATYSNPYKFQIEDAMGQGAFFFVPDDVRSAMQ